MPTSATSTYEFINVGPLTTTFTAPSACVTDYSLAALADGHNTWNVVLAESCVAYDLKGDCYPSGSAIDALISTRGPEYVDSRFPMPYYSPGLHCPDGFTTAGVAEKSASGEISATGIFSMTAFNAYGGLPESTPPLLPMANMLASALDEGETAVICCKR